MLSHLRTLFLVSSLTVLVVNGSPIERGTGTLRF
jgi:hypothetical protein